MKIERILYPTDFSEGSSQALYYAVDLANKYNAKLYVLHIIYDITKAYDSHVPHVSSDQLYSEMNEWALKEINSRYIEELRGLKNVEKKVIKGIPYDEILDFAGEEKIDLIVMGTYGRVGLQRLIFGSTAEKVVRRAPCPVMTVRVPEHRK